MSRIKVHDLSETKTTGACDSFEMFSRYYQAMPPEGLSVGCSPDRITAAKKFLRRSLRSLPPAKEHIVLEVGCGSGEMSRWLAGKGYTVHGVDFVPEVITYASGRPKSPSDDLTFHVGDAVHLTDFQDNVFHCVIDGRCLHYIRSSDRSRYLSNAYRVLEDGGLFLVMTRCLPGGDREPDRNNAGNPTGYEESCFPRYIASAGKISMEVKAAGFVIIDERISSFEEGKSPDLFIRARKD